MNLGLDFHGVIDAKPELFQFLTKSWINNGGKVYIITGGTLKNSDIIDNLNRWDIHYSEIISIYDYLVDNKYPRTGEKLFPDGTIQIGFSNELWDKQKGELARKLSIDLHIDDTLIYSDFFTTPFARFFSKNGKPKKGDKDGRLLD
jgi:hypothetical protein